MEQLPAEFMGDLQGLGEKLKQVGWARTFTADERCFDIAWTAEGKAGIERIFHALRDFGPKGLTSGELAALRCIAWMDYTSIGLDTEHDSND